MKRLLWATVGGALLALGCSGESQEKLGNLPPTAQLGQVKQAVFSDTGTLDRTATVFQEQTTDNAGGYSGFCIGNVGGGANTRRGYVRWDMPTIPSGSTVTRVLIVFEQNRVRTSGMGAPKTATLRMDPITSSWTEGSGTHPVNAGPCSGGAVVSGIDWGSRPTDGSQSASQLMGTSGDVTVDTDVGSNDDDLITDVQGWIDTPSTNHGWMIRVEEESTSDNARWVDVDSLTIEYTVSNGSACSVDSDCTSGQCVRLSDGTACSGISCTGDAGVCCTTNTCADSVCDPFTGCSSGGACQNTAASSGTSCGSGADTECTNPDTCDGAGNCSANHESSGTACGDQGVDCLVDDTCDGAGNCTNNGFEANGTACGSTANTECTNPDTCNGSGTCLDNHATSGAPCGDQGVECLVDDTCNGSGSCTNNGFEANGTACGSSADTECTDPDTCNGSGTCLDNHATSGAACGTQGVECFVDDTCDGNGGCTNNGFEGSGTPCGSSADTECTNPDTCNGAGACQDNHEPSGTGCGDQGVECLVDDTCNGSGSCTNNGFEPNGTACGSTANTECTNPDTCNGSGTCLDNHATSGAPCGDQGVECLNDDTCNGSGGCNDNGFEASGTSCGSSADTECTDPDSCDGAGTCESNHAASGDPCGTQGVECLVDDTCNGSGGCTDNGFETSGTPCGDSSNTECTNPDTCNGLGTCRDNHAASGAPCGDQGVECLVDDTCNGSGSCTNNGFEPSGTACGDTTDTDCLDPDQCNGSGSCLPNDPPDGTVCTDDGETCTVDICASGVCTHPAGNGGTQCSGPSCDPGPPPVATLASVCDGVTTSCPAAGTVNCTGTCVGTACGDCTQDSDCQPPPNRYCGGGACLDKKAAGDNCGGDNECLSDNCVNGICCVSPSCDDGVSCTNDTCTPGTGICANVADDSLCDNGQFCDGSETCNATLGCQAGTTPNCNDGVGCTVDSCNEGTDSCDNVASDALCDNGQFCDGSETCDATLDCQAGTAPNCNDGVSCTVDSCNEGTDVCDNVATDSLCDNGTFCDGAETCDATLDCQTGTPPTCDDGVGCTNDSCNTGTDSCDNVPDDTICDNGQFCDGNETCNASTGCEAGAAPNCDDSVGCTTDSCNEGTDACDNIPDDSVCDDFNVCTTDSCDAVLDCVGTPVSNGTVCADADVCNGDETCQSGVCTAGTPLNCDDGNECTSNSCDSGLGCQTTNLLDGTPCTDDGELCTTDECIGGTCSHPAGNAGTSCRASTGVCDVGELCDGIAPTCPVDGFEPMTTVCRAASCTAGVATLEATCPGDDVDCPAVSTQNCTPFLCVGDACGTTCADDTECAIDNYCSVSTCVPKQANGGACTAPNECLSGICTDGFCCNVQCGGQCEACDVTGVEGTCSPVTGAPHGGRPACPGDNTGCDGVCDGVNTVACTLPGPSLECRPPSCTGGVATLQAFCQGDGSCPPVQVQDCGAFTCGPTQCEGGCVTEAQCVPGNYCSGGVCVPLLPNGSACSGDVQCENGACVDGFCCDSVCDGQCEACNLGGQEGTCSPVTGAPVGGRTPCADDGGVCGGACDGTNTTACAYPGIGVECRAGTCTNGIATLRAFCNGTGFCPPAQQQDCGAPGCDGDVCDGDCVGDSDCSVGEFCAAGVCSPQLPLGDSCQASNQCTSGFCVDGFCCASECLGQCEACDVVGDEGVCTPVVGAPHGTRVPCLNDGTACAGACDGVDGTTCQYPDDTTVCRPGSCSADVATLEAVCDGAGSCPPTQLQPCAPFTCGATACAGDCVDTTDCAAGQYCSGGVCVAQLADGAFCGADEQCVSTFCVDGVCCESACSGQCEACGEVGSQGTCTVVSGSPRGGRAACGGTGACGGACDGTLPNTCTFASPSQTCGVAACLAEALLATAPTCNGAGTCLPGAAQDCAPFVCAGDACLTTCTNDDDCVAGFVCNMGVCQMPMPDGGMGGMSGAAGMGGGGMGGVTAGGAGGAGGGTVDAGVGGSGGGTGGGTTFDGGVSGAAGNGMMGGSGGVEATDPDKGGGCGCRVPGQPREGGGAFALLALLGLAALRRRRSAA